MMNMPVGSWLQSLRRTCSCANTTRRPSGGAERYVSRALVTRRGGKQCTPPHSLISDAQKKRERLFETSSGSGLNSLYILFANQCHQQPRLSELLCRGSQESRSSRMTTRRLTAILEAD